MLAQQRLELASMATARVAMRAVHPAPVPRQPAARIGVDVLSVAEVEQLALERQLGLGVGSRPADVAPEHDHDRHHVKVARERVVDQP
jgi:hypothetical protein